MSKKIPAILVTLLMITIVALSLRGPQDGWIALAANSYNGISLPSHESLTLLEAWEVVEAHGAAWDAQAAVASLRSVDAPGDGQASGQDGRRRAWAAVLISPEASLWLGLVDGKIVDEVVQPLSPGSAPLSRPGIDSPQALTLARAARPQLVASGSVKSLGFHFGLEAPASGRAALSVLGAVDLRPARLQLDPLDGTLLSAQVYTYAPLGGVLVSSDAGQTWQASTLQGRMVTALASDPLQESRAYAVTAGQEFISIYQTEDGGTTWQRLTDLPPQAGDWPYDLLALRDRTDVLTLLVGTWNGLWASSAGGEWARAEGLPQGPAQWLASIRSGDESRSFVSVSTGKGRGLYRADDLAHWTRISENVYRLSASFDRQSVLAASETRPGEGLRLGLYDETPVPLPGVVLQAAGDFQGAAPVLFHSPDSGSGASSRLGLAAQWTLSAPVASLAASPDFPADRLALAGGFRSGIFHTTDGGEHWERVLDDPSSVLPGSGEIYDILFLSPAAVIAVNGGQITWQDF